MIWFVFFVISYSLIWNSIYIGYASQKNQWPVCTCCWKQVAWLPSGLKAKGHFACRHHKPSHFAHPARIWLKCMLPGLLWLGRRRNIDLKRSKGLSGGLSGKELQPTAAFRPMCGAIHVHTKPKAKRNHQQNLGSSHNQHQINQGKLDSSSSVYSTLQNRLVHD